MKIITDKAAYLQKYYFGILLKSTLVTKVGVPISICDVVNKKKFDKYDSKDFVKFTKREEIEFLKNTTWIPNFNDYDKKTSDEIREEIVSLDNDGNELNKWFQSLSKEEQQIKYEYASIKAKMLMYKKESLNDILAFVSSKESSITVQKSKKRLFNVRQSSERVMIGSGENAIFVNMKKGEKYMLPDGTVVRAGDTPEESRRRLDDRFDDIVYSKPVAFIKKITRRIKSR